MASTATTDLKEMMALLVKREQEGSTSLTDDELKHIIAASEELKSVIHHIWRWGLYNCEIELRYRKRRLELDALSTDELSSTHERIAAERQRIIAEDFTDELDDSFYESPPRDSEEHIVYELLKERGVK